MESIDPTLKSAADLAAAAVAAADASLAADINASDSKEDDKDPLSEASQSPAPEEKPKRARGIVPGSSADFRRKEANRLAAVRSRYRAQDKKTLLQKKEGELKEENERLKGEIAKLEADGVVDSTLGDIVDSSSISKPDPPPQEDVEVKVKVTKKGGIGVGRGVSAGASNDQPAGQDNEMEGDTEPTSGDAAQDSHSRTILAALMSDAVGDGDAFVPGEGGDEDEWMQGVEDMFKEAETSGRLGELAAVAAVRGDDGDGEEEKEEEQGGEESGHEVVLPRRELATLVYHPGQAIEATSSAMAVALNVEVERLLREDLVATKLAIGRVEKQIAQTRDGTFDDSLANNIGDDPLSMPRAMFANDQGTLQRHAGEQREHIQKLQEGMQGHRASVMQAKQSKLNVESVLAGKVGELQALMKNQEGVEKERTANVLRELTGYIGSLLGTIEDPVFNTSYSSPAFALRTRGRPSKTSAGLSTKPRSSRKSPTAHGDGLSVPGTPTPATTRRGKRKSKLSEQVMPDTQPEDKSEVPASAVETVPETQHSADASETERLLDHLRDTSTFAGLLPDDADGSTQLDPNLDLDTTALEDQPADGAETAGEGSAGTQVIDASVLSRLKKGPPGSCDICGRTETSVWRKLSLGDQDLKVCNACGLYHVKFGVIRPAELWGDGKSIKKRRTAPRGSTVSATQGENGEAEGEEEEGPVAKKQKTEPDSSDLNGATLDVRDGVVDTDEVVEDDFGDILFNHSGEEGEQVI